MTLVSLAISSLKTSSPSSVAPLHPQYTSWTFWKRDTVTSSKAAVSSHATVTIPKRNCSPLSRVTWCPTIFFPPLDIPSVCKVKFPDWRSFFCAAWIVATPWASSTMLATDCKQGKSLSSRSVSNNVLKRLMTDLHFVAGTFPSACRSHKVLTLSVKRFLSVLILGFAAQSLSVSLAWSKLFMYYLSASFSSAAFTAALFALLALIRMAVLLLLSFKMIFLLLLVYSESCAETILFSQVYFSFSSWEQDSAGEAVSAVPHLSSEVLERLLQVQWLPLYNS